MAEDIEPREADEDQLVDRSVAHGDEHVIKFTEACLRRLLGTRLAEYFDMTKPSMSHHFAVLKQADLVAARRAGQQIYYALNTTVVEDLLAAVWDLFPSRSRTPPKNGRQEK